MVIRYLFRPPIIAELFFKLLHPRQRSMYVLKDPDSPKNTQEESQQDFFPVSTHPDVKLRPLSFLRKGGIFSSLQFFKLQEATFYFQLSIGQAAEIGIAC